MIKFRERTNTWPGFVDLFSNLVIVLIFLLIVFVFLWTTTSIFNSKTGAKKMAELTRINAEQSEQIVQMTADEQEAKRLLILAHAELEHLESTKASLEDEVNNLDSSVKNKDAKIEDLVLSYEDKVKQIQLSSENMRAMIQSLNAQLSSLNDQLNATQSQSIAAQSQTEAEKAELANQRNNLEQQLVTLNQQLADMNAALQAAEVKSQQQEVNYVEMSTRLNRALADKAAEAAMYANEAAKYAEMSKYQSEFFKAIKLAFANDPNIDTSSDRFLIPSDILFASGSFDLSPEGKKQLNVIANVIKNMENVIPQNVAWIIRVDGHTDTKPVVPGNRAYKNNTELSLLRARAVARELGEKGVNRKRLVPSGFGELHPAIQGESPTALQKNRRIELRLTNP